MYERGLHARGERLVPGADASGLSHTAVAVASQPGGLGGDQRRVAAVPAVRTTITIPDVRSVRRAHLWLNSRNDSPIRVPRPSRSRCRRPGPAHGRDAALHDPVTRVRRVPNTNDSVRTSSCGRAPARSEQQPQVPLHRGRGCRPAPAGSRRLADLPRQTHSVSSPVARFWRNIARWATRRPCGWSRTAACAGAEARTEQVDEPLGVAQLRGVIVEVTIAQHLAHRAGVGQIVTPSISTSSSASLAASMPVDAGPTSTSPGLARLVRGAWLASSSRSASGVRPCIRFGGSLRPRRRQNSANTRHRPRGRPPTHEQRGPASRTMPLLPMLTRPRAPAKSIDAAMSTGSPAARSARPNPTDSASSRRPSISSPVGASRIGDPFARRAHQPAMADSEEATIDDRRRTGAPGP